MLANRTPIKKYTKKKKSEQRILNRQVTKEEIVLLTILLVKLFLKRFYLFIHERHRKREAETQEEGEAGSVQKPQCGTQS